MAKVHTTIRKIDGKTYRCRDIGCDDFDRAARNREMVKNKQNIVGYLIIETAVSKTPLTQPLPAWITSGELPYVSKKQWNDMKAIHQEEWSDELALVVKELDRK